tara:strand:- start:486 stop:1901 length:1416 start_codon:yes stop_codon:yes gene_type:complete
MVESPFLKLGLISSIEKRLIEKKYNNPTPIQEKTISRLLEGTDLLGIAQTGSGKTAAFSLPILQHLSLDIINNKSNKVENVKKEKRKPIPRALVIAPTRELALQIGKSIESYGRYLSVSHTVIYGGIKQLYQVAALNRGVDIIVATPGRLLDLIQQGYANLENISHLVLDEADLMLDMGFIKDIEKILKNLPSKKQTMLFSATMPAEVSKLAKNILNNPIRVDVTPQKIILDQIKQYVYLIDTRNKMNLLFDLLKSKKMTHTIIFRKTKRGANYLGQKLYRSGFRAETIHGDKTQSARQRALRQFEKGRAKILVATDVASRGIDFSRVSHVINYELPNIPENYIHRIGRTARAGSEGIAYSFCDVSEISFLRNIEKKSKQKIQISPHAYENQKKTEGKPENFKKNQNRIKSTKPENSTSKEKTWPKRNKRKFEKSKQEKKLEQSTPNKDKRGINTPKEKKKFHSHKKKKKF